MAAAPIDPHRGSMSAQQSFHAQYRAMEFRESFASGLDDDQHEAVGHESQASANQNDGNAIQNEDMEIQNEASAIQNEARAIQNESSAIPNETMAIQNEACTDEGQADVQNSGRHYEKLQAPLAARTVGNSFYASLGILPSQFNTSDI